MDHGEKTRVTGDPLLEGFKKFSAELQLPTPIPLDIIPLLTRDVPKQFIMAFETRKAILFPRAYHYDPNDPRFQKPAQYTYPPGRADTDNKSTFPYVYRRGSMSAKLSSSPSHYEESECSFQAPYYNMNQDPPTPIQDAPDPIQDAPIPIQGHSRHQILSKGQWLDFMIGPKHINPPPPAPRNEEIASIMTSDFTEIDPDENHPNIPDIKKSSPAFRYMIRKDPYPRFDDVRGFMKALDVYTRPLIRCIPEPGVAVHLNLEAILWETESMLRAAFLHRNNTTVAEALLRMKCCRELAARITAGEWDEKC